MSKPLLPPNVSVLERAAASALAEIERVPIPLRDLWNPDTCPERLLPYLAWSFSVDQWDESWPETAKREAVRNSFFVHQSKGTIAALRRIVEPLGYVIDIEEWWQQEPEGEPGTFSFSLGLQETALSPEIFAEIERLIDNARPVSRHVVGMRLRRDLRGITYTGGVISSGVATSIYPPEA